MAKSGSSTPSGASAFDGEEPTEVMPARTKSAAPPPEPENKDKQYVAPCEIPAARVPLKDQEGAKIVINVPEKRGDNVAGERARRRAPTVKLSRAEVDLAKMKTRGIEPTLPDQPAFQIDVTLDDLEDGDTAKRANGYIEPAKPIAEAPRVAPASSRPPPSSGVAARGAGARGDVAAVGSFGARALEPPPTSMPVGSSPKTERSRAPWIFLGVLLIGGGVAGAIFVTQKGSSSSEPQAATPPPPTPSMTATAASTAIGTGAAATSQGSTASADAMSATAAPTDATTAAPSATQPLAGVPRTGLRPTSTFARPPVTATVPRATAKPPPPKSGGDIPSGI